MKSINNNFIMESKLCRQQSVMNSLAQPKYRNSLLEKNNTWSNLLNKKSVSTNTATTNNTKQKTNSAQSCAKKSKSVQCESPCIKESQSTTTLSVFNPIRTLQFLLKEINHLPNVQNTDISKIVQDMQVVVERIVDECSKVSNIKSNNILVDSSMIPTKDNYCNDFKSEKTSKENEYWLTLHNKIIELENNYAKILKTVKMTEEKLVCVTSERDKIIGKFKETCNSLEILNNREREYLDTIASLKSKLMASEKLVYEQEVTIKELTKQINNVSKNNVVNNFTKKIIPEEEKKESITNFNENKLKTNEGVSKFDHEKSKKVHNANTSEVAKLRFNIKKMKDIVMSGLENDDFKNVSMASLISNKYPLKSGDEDRNIDRQFNEYNRQASAIKSAKFELNQLFDSIKAQTNHSKELFDSTQLYNNSNLLSDISDDEDNYSNKSNFMSVLTNSSC
ncbi:TNF receptor-associated factor family protein DDB_G0272098-like [Adelges cooleyi]|uniref:TNF receptor-associated factor family protein DDB_G0272098-like n=1 Tax=Adelges cooleyi TaxID=133065 RepID=UPI00217FF60D|nr:TNF receptor-associated factor family protein DDB_G0272098-like [Adelges cooleyi]XP_050432089.1 TNF receptor-associated factor family protein DDB_G0272098-like [Adelges cooleyi]